MDNQNIIQKCVGNYYLLKDTQYLYHATPACYVSSIKKYGLGGKMPKTRLWDYEDTEYEHIQQGCFLATDEYDAEAYVESSDQFDELADEYEDKYDKELEIVVFRINVDDLDLSLLKQDTNQQDSNNTFFYNGVIPYANLKKIKLYD